MNFGGGYKHHLQKHLQGGYFYHGAHGPHVWSQTTRLALHKEYLASKLECRHHLNVLSTVDGSQLVIFLLLRLLVIILVIIFIIIDINNIIILVTIVNVIYHHSHCHHQCDGEKCIQLTYMNLVKDIFLQIGNEVTIIMF